MNNQTNQLWKTVNGDQKCLAYALVAEIITELFTFKSSLLYLGNPDYITCKSLSLHQGIGSSIKSDNDLVTSFASFGAFLSRYFFLLLYHARLQST